MVTDDLLTVGDIARELESDPQRVAYIIQTRRLAPVGRVGIVRVFTRDTLNAIATAIREIDARRAARSAC